MPDGAPQAACSRTDLTPLHYEETAPGVFNGPEIQAQRTTSGDTPPYVLHIDAEGAQDYDASTVLPGMLGFFFWTYRYSKVFLFRWFVIPNIP